MRKIVLLLIFLFILLFSTSVFADGKYTLERLVLPNFIYSPCHFFKPDPGLLVMQLDERYVNTQGSNLAPTSCKGGSVCWSWKILSQGENLWDIQIFSSELPLKITNLKKISESISTTIKKNQNLRKSTGNLVSAAQEFINSNFGTGKEKGITKEHSMTQSESRERAIELNVTPQFHMFLSKAIMGPFVASYPFCISSAIDLFFKAYNTDRSDDLIHAFVIFKTLKPEDIDFSNQNDILNRAKFLFSLLIGISGKDMMRLNAGWAQAVLFAQVLNWQEFEEVRKFVDSEIQKTYSKYVTLLEKTTAEIGRQDKNLAVIKYRTDKKLRVNDNELKQKQNEIKDNYIETAFISFVSKPDEKEIKEYETALEKNDPLLYKKFILPETYSSKILLNVFIGLSVVIIAVFVTTIIYKKIKAK